MTLRAPRLRTLPSMLSFLVGLPGLALAYALGRVRRDSPPASVSQGSRRLTFVSPHPPSARSGGGTAIKGLLDLLEPHYDIDLVVLSRNPPKAGWIARRVGSLITRSLPMPPALRPLVLRPGLVQELTGGCPVLFDFLSGAVFLLFAPRPAVRTVLRDHEVLHRRLRIERDRAVGLLRMERSLAAAACWLLTATIYEKTDLIVALTPEDADYLRVHFPRVRDRVTTIRSPLPPLGDNGGPAPGGSADPNQLLMVANFYHRPNVEGLEWFLAECAPHLRPGFVLHLVGLDQPLGPRLFEGHNVRVVRHGFVPNLDAELATAAIAVAPVVTGSGVRIKNLFLAQKGKAIVTTSLGNEGIGFVPDEEALICDGGQAMAQAINGLAADPERMRSLGAAARERVRRAFAPEAILERYRSEVFPV